MSSAVDQTTSALSAMSTYFSSLSTYLDGGSSTLPTLDSIIAAFDYTELYNLVYLNQQGGANYANGTLIETIHHMAAITREYGMRTKAKADYYADATSDLSGDSTYYGNLSTQYSANIAGISATTAVSS